MLRFASAGLTLALFLPTAGAAQSGVPALTLSEAIARAARTDPNVVQAQGNVRSTGAAVLAAKGSFLPSLNGTATGGSSFNEGPSRTDPITGEIISGSSSSQSLSLGLNAGVDLFTGFRRGADLRAARASEDAADAGLIEQRSQSARTTSLQFFETLAAAELVAVREASIRREQEKLQIAIARLSTRAATISDSLNAVVSLAEARLALLSQQARLAGAEASLGRLVGMDGRVAAAKDPSLERFDLVVDRDALMTEASAKAPSVLRAESQARASRAQVSAARSGYWPSVSLSAGTTFSGSDRNDFELFNGRSVNLTVSFPFFNRFGRERQIASASATAETDAARAEDARRLVLANLATQLASLETARERVSVTRLGLDAARANVNVQLERYRLGSITIVELGVAQDALNRAEEQGVTARTDFLRAKAEIEAILGRPL